MGQLWVQENLRRGDFQLHKVRGEHNPAGIQTTRDLPDRVAAEGGWQSGNSALSSVGKPRRRSAVKVVAASRRRHSGRSSGVKGACVLDGAPPEPYASQQSRFSKIGIGVHALV